MSDSQWMQLWQDTAADRDRIDRRHSEMLYAIIVGEDATLLGRPVKFTLEWPAGRPMRMSETELREWAAENLRRLRANDG